MKSFLFVLLCFGIAPLAVAQEEPAPAVTPVSHVQVRLVTFQKAGAATALEAALPECDESLYAALAAEAAAGGAVRRVFDQTVIVRSGQRSKVEAVREYGYPSETNPHPQEGRVYPGSMMSRNVGQTLEVEANAGEEEQRGVPRFLDINMAPELVTLPAVHPWPVPDFSGGGRMGRVSRPVFGNHKLTTQVLTWTGRTMLLSTAPGPEAVFSSGAAPEFCYTFLRAGVNGDKPAAAAVAAGRAETYPAMRQRRLHFLSVRLPRNEAAALMLRHAGDDAALYAALSQQVKAGRAVLANHAAIVCREGQRSKVESAATFEMASSYRDLIPDSWTDFSPGTQLEVETVAEEKDGEGPCGLWNVAFTAREAPELVPYYPSAKHPALHGAVGEYVERNVLSHVRIPASGVRCTSVLSTTGPTEEEGDEDAGGVTDVSFAIQSPPPGKADPDATPHVLLQAAILSVPAAEGPALAKNFRAADAAGRLLERLGAGETTCAAHAGVTLRAAGLRSSAKCVRHVQQPVEYAQTMAAQDVRVPGSWNTTGCGVELEAEYYYDGGKGITLNGHMGWDAAPVAGFGEPGAEVPEMKVRRSAQDFAFRDLVLKAGVPVIVDVRASGAREGTPEYGRWHVVVMVAR